MNKIWKYKKFLSLCFILVIIISSNAFSQVRTLTLEDAINEAYKNNSDLINARYDKLKAEYRVSQTTNESLIPSISVNSLYTRAFKKQVINIFGQNYEIGTDNAISNVVSVQEPIPILGTPIFQGIRVAKQYAMMSDENVRATESKVKTDVRKSFLNALLLTDVVSVTEKSLQNAMDNLAIVEIKYKGGAVTEFDYLRAKVQVENIKPSLSQAKNNLVISQKALKNAIGMKTDEEIKVSGNLTYDSTEIFGDFDKIIENISENNVSMRLLRINKNINEELLGIDKLNYLPKLYLFGQYELISNEDDGRKLSDYRFYNVVNAGIGLTWNFNLFSNPQKVKQSEIEVKKNEEQLKDIKEKLKIQSQSVVLNLQNAKERIISNSQNVDTNLLR